MKSTHQINVSLHVSTVMCIMGQKSGFLFDLLKLHNVLPGLSFPRRPSWSYNMTRDSLLKKEEKSYRDYLDDMHSRNAPGTLSHFEHNLEVKLSLLVLNFVFGKYQILCFIEISFGIHLAQSMNQSKTKIRCAKGHLESPAAQMTLAGCTMKVLQAAGSLFYVWMCSIIGFGFKMINWL